MGGLGGAAVWGEALAGVGEVDGVEVGVWVGGGGWAGGWGGLGVGEVGEVVADGERGEV